MTCGDGVALHNGVGVPIKAEGATADAGIVGFYVE